MKNSILLIGLTVFLALTSFQVFATGLSDPYISAGKVRTEYDNGFGIGSNKVDLTYDQDGNEGCLFDYDDNTFGACPGRSGLGTEVWSGLMQNHEACEDGGDTTIDGDTWANCRNYSTNTYFSQLNPGSTYWMIHANNEPSFDQCNSGPPGASELVKDPSAGGLFRVRSIPYQPNPFTWRSRIHFIIYNNDGDWECNGVTIPFLSVGAQYGRGNSTPVGVINSNLSETVQDRVQFGFEILAYSTVTGWSGVYLMAEWDGIPRMIQVPFFRRGGLGGSSVEAATANWNWPVEQSIYFPGAEVAILPIGSTDISSCGLDIDEIETGDIGTTQYFDFNASEVFNCASDLGLITDMPENEDIYLNGIHFYSETVGASGYIWAMIEDVIISN